MSTHLDGKTFVPRTVDWINSIRILKLIAWTEHLTGRRIPDKAIRMDNFRTVRRIADVFCASETEGGADVAA